MNRGPDDSESAGSVSRLSRRGLLRAAGVGTAVLGGIAAAPAGVSAAASTGDNRGGAGQWRPDPESPRFTLAVMPDTQYMFDQDRIHPAPIEASFRYLLGAGPEHNVVFLAHLGDMTQNGLASEFAEIGKSFAMLDRSNAAYSVLAGNHDINSHTDDQRGGTPYLDTFGPKRFARSKSFGGATPDGYNTFHTFRAAGREWLVLAMDWRPSAAGIAWANQVIKAHPHTPVILTTHELVSADGGDGRASLSGFGQQLWDQLIAGNDQIFLTLNGHFWPPGSLTKQNNSGHDVHLHITNYQNRYYGGAAMVRLYHFDLARNTIDVETVAPWVLAQPAEQRNLLERQEVELTSAVDYFAIPVNFEARFAGFAPTPPRPARPAHDLVVPGTVAYWRFDGQTAGGALTGSTTVTDLSGNHNDLTIVPGPGATANALTWSGDFHPDQPGHGSLLFTGGYTHGSYLRTGPNAKLNAATFQSGYTIEAFFKLPADWDGNANAWTALLSRWGMSSEAGKNGPNTDPQEPIATLSLSGGRELQWCIYPLNQTGSATNWGHELPLNAWWHVAVVNDGKHTTMYVDGCPVVRNPSTPSTGIITLNQPWLLGGYEYDGTINQIFYGLIGDLRIVNRALPVNQFMNVR